MLAKVCVDSRWPVASVRQNLGAKRFRGLLVSDTFTPTGQQLTELLIINYTQEAVEVSSSLELVALVHWFTGSLVTV